jgi:hypothetical protein
MRALNRQAIYPSTQKAVSDLSFSIAIAALSSEQSLSIGNEYDIARSWSTVFSLTTPRMTNRSHMPLRSFELHLHVRETTLSGFGSGPVTYLTRDISDHVNVLYEIGLGIKWRTIAATYRSASSSLERRPNTV